MRSNESVEKKIFVILVEIVLIKTLKLVFTGYKSMTRKKLLKQSEKSTT